jgi:hypothetical protein
VSVPTATTGLVDWLSIEWGSARWRAASLPLTAMVLLLVASLGFGRLAPWLQRRQTAAPAAAAGVPAAEGTMPAEPHFPLAVVAAHGLVAATTLALVLLAALKVGGS